jgi:hypothetical protein
MRSFDSEDFGAFRSGCDVEEILHALGRPGPGADFRTRVLASMEVAAEERRLMLADHGRLTAPEGTRAHRLPAWGAGLVALVVMVAAVKPWSAVTEGPLHAADAPSRAVPGARMALLSDEPADLHHALELLDARRELFAVVQAGGRPGVEF